MLLGTTTFGRRAHLLSSSTGLVLTFMRSLGVSSPSAATETIQEGKEPWLAHMITTSSHSATYL